MFNLNSIVAAAAAVLISTAFVAVAVGPAAAFDRDGAQVASVQAVLVQAAA